MATRYGAVFRPNDSSGVASLMNWQRQGSDCVPSRPRSPQRTTANSRPVVVGAPPAPLPLRPSDRTSCRNEADHGDAKQPSDSRIDNLQREVEFLKQTIRTDAERARNQRAPSSQRASSRQSSGCGSPLPSQRISSRHSSRGPSPRLARNQPRSPCSSQRTGPLVIHGGGEFSGTRSLSPLKQTAPTIGRTTDLGDWGKQVPAAILPVRKAALDQRGSDGVRALVQNTFEDEQMMPRRGKSPVGRTGSPSPRHAPWLRNGSPMSTHEIRRYGMTGSRVDPELTRNASRRQVGENHKNATSDHTWTAPMEQHDAVSLRKTWDALKLSDTWQLRGA